MPYLLTFRIGLSSSIGFGIGCLPCSLLRLLLESHYRPEWITYIFVLNEIEIETESYVEQKSLHNIRKGVGTKPQCSKFPHPQSRLVTNIIAFLPTKYTLLDTCPQNPMSLNPQSEKGSDKRLI